MGKRSDRARSRREGREYQVSSINISDAQHFDLFFPFLLFPSSLLFRNEAERYNDHRIRCGRYSRARGCIEISQKARARAHIFVTILVASLSLQVCARVFCARRFTLYTLLRSPSSISWMQAVDDERSSSNLSRDCHARARATRMCFTASVSFAFGAIHIPRVHNVIRSQMFEMYVCNICIRTYTYLYLPTYQPYARQ